MFELEDLTLLTDTELTDEQWTQIAVKEYFRYWLQGTSLDYCDNKGRCSRKANHIGPCIKLIQTAEMVYVNGKQLIRLDARRDDNI